MEQDKTHSESHTHPIRNTLRKVFSFRHGEHKQSSDGDRARKYPCTPDSYDLIEECGSGATSQVWKALCKPYNEMVAIKLIQLGENSTTMEAFTGEAKTMSQLHHPHLLPLYCSFLEGEMLWLVMPYVDVGNMATIMETAFPQGVSEHVIATIMKAVLEGLGYLHQHGIIHRDVKASNTLISKQGHVYLADFSIAAVLPQPQLPKLTDGTADYSEGDPEGTLEGPGGPAEGPVKEEGASNNKCNSFAGSICWMAPEVIEGTGYDYKADIWSYGITLLELLRGKCPLADMPAMQVMMQTLHGNPDRLMPEDLRCSKVLRDLLCKCLHKDPASRPTASKLLEHKFLKEAQDSDYLVRKLLSPLPEKGSNLGVYHMQQQQFHRQQSLSKFGSLFGSATSTRGVNSPTSGVHGDAFSSRPASPMPKPCTMGLDIFPIHSSESWDYPDGLSTPFMSAAPHTESADAAHSPSIPQSLEGEGSGVEGAPEGVFRKRSRPSTAGVQTGGCVRGSPGSRPITPKPPSGAPSGAPSGVDSLDSWEVPDESPFPSLHRRSKSFYVVAAEARLHQAAAILGDSPTKHTDSPTSEGVWALAHHDSQFSQPNSPYSHSQTHSHHSQPLSQHFHPLSQHSHPYSQSSQHCQPHSPHTPHTPHTPRVLPHDPPLPVVVDTHHRVTLAEVMLLFREGEALQEGLAEGSGSPGTITAISPGAHQVQYARQTSWRFPSPTHTTAEGPSGGPLEGAQQHEFSLHLNRCNAVGSSTCDDASLCEEGSSNSSTRTSAGGTLAGSLAGSRGSFVGGSGSTRSRSMTAGMTGAPGALEGSLLGALETTIEEEISLEAATQDRQTTGQAADGQPHRHISPFQSQLWDGHADMLLKQLSGGDRVWTGDNCVRLDCERVPAGMAASRLASHIATVHNTDTVHNAATVQNADSSAAECGARQEGDLQSCSLHGSTASGKQCSEQGCSNVGDKTQDEAVLQGSVGANSCACEDTAVQQSDCVQGQHAADGNVPHVGHETTECSRDSSVAHLHTQQGTTGSQKGPQKGPQAPAVAVSVAVDCGAASEDRTTQPALSVQTGANSQQQGSKTSSSHGSAQRRVHRAAADDVRPSTSANTSNPSISSPSSGNGIARHRRAQSVPPSTSPFATTSTLGAPTSAASWATAEHAATARQAMLYDRMPSPSSSSPNLSNLSGGGDQAISRRVAGQGDSMSRSTESSEGSPRAEGWRDSGGSAQGPSWGAPGSRLHPPSGSFRRKSLERSDSDSNARRGLSRMTSTSTTSTSVSRDTETAMDVEMLLGFTVGSLLGTPSRLSTQSLSGAPAGSSGSQWAQEGPPRMPPNMFPSILEGDEKRAAPS